MSRTWQYTILGTFKYRFRCMCCQAYMLPGAMQQRGPKTTTIIIIIFIIIITIIITKYPDGLAQVCIDRFTTIKTAPSHQQ